jgi:hypothetical protein
MEDNDASVYIGSRDNTLYLRAELERAFERGGIDWATRDVDRFRERLARLMVRLAPTRNDADEAFSVAPATSDDNQHDGLSSVTEGTSPKID